MKKLRNKFMIKQNNFWLFTIILLLMFSINVNAQKDSVEVDLSKYRYSYDEMYKIANPKLLKHRIFYEKPSIGSDAAWFDAVKQGDLDLVKQMVESGQNLEVKDEASLGQTALGWASFIGYLDIVQYLVEQGADIRATDKADVYNTVKSATLGGNAEVLAYLYGLLQDEVDWDAIEEDGETLLSVAAVDGRLEALQYILQFNPKSINVIVEKYNMSPLSGACERGFPEVAEVLIKHGAINHKTGKSSCE